MSNRIRETEEGWELFDLVDSRRVVARATSLEAINAARRLLQPDPPYLGSGTFAHGGAGLAPYCSFCRITADCPRHPG